MFVNPDLSSHQWQWSFHYLRSAKNLSNSFFWKLCETVGTLTYIYIYIYIYICIHIFIYKYTYIYIYIYRERHTKNWHAHRPSQKHSLFSSYISPVAVVSVHSNPNPNWPSTSTQEPLTHSQETSQLSCETWCDFRIQSRHHFCLSLNRCARPIVRIGIAVHRHTCYVWDALGGTKKS